jgi:hypothetical protein
MPREAIFGRYRRDAVPDIGRKSVFWKSRLRALGRLAGLGGAPDGRPGTTRGTTPGTTRGTTPGTTRGTTPGTTRGTTPGTTRGTTP